MKGKIPRIFVYLGVVLVVILFPTLILLFGTTLVFADNGDSANGSNTWGIIGAILVPLLTILSIYCGAKWAKAIKALKEASEALVALGMCGIKLAKLLEKPGQASAAQVEEVLAQVKVVAEEFREAIVAATSLFRRTKRLIE